jgi:GTP-binding protein
MKITSATFEISAPDLESCPDETLPEFAFIGRSNVGKSSLLNLLSGKRDLAKVSDVPGHTKLINFFKMNKAWRLVDLPGYGYAHVARENRAQFNDAVTGYLENRGNLFCVFVLIDSRLAPQPIDLEFVRWLGTQDAPFVLVFTKTDKAQATQVQKNIDLFKSSLSGREENLPQVFTSSAVTKRGVTELLSFIEKTLA